MRDVSAGRGCACARPSCSSRRPSRERQSALVMPDNQDDGAPPNRTTVDLDARIAVVRMPPAPS
ncbi:DUF6191 domain-containing protein [Streptomyces sp. YS415]|uniref:DUF6191 domain-containing protein n=1 Tax=Streptomyces sp. YS415 TaxID=2944806 RepID=UPI0035AB95E7